MTETRCYHCGLPVPPKTDFTVDILGQHQPMCCIGCQAIAMAIVDGGLDRFYRFRTGLSDTPKQTTLEKSANDKLAYYDLPEIQEDFVTSEINGNSTAPFIIKGITCSACAWLIEKYLSSFAGITKVHVNVSNHRCLLTWDSSQIQLSQTLVALEDIGYEARPANDVEFEQLRDQENKQYLLRLGLAGLAMMQAGMVAIGLYAGDFYGIEPQWQTLLRWVSFTLVTPVVFYSARPFFTAAWRSLRIGHLVMDVPVSLAIALAYSASTWATFTGTGEVYFDSVSMFTFFLLLGRYLEARVRHRNESLSYSFARLIPPVATRLEQAGEKTVPIKSLQIGDSIRIGTGDTIPCDGEIINGNSDVTEAVLTGEQKPVNKHQGSWVSAGTINITNPLEIEVHALGKNTRLATILNLAETAEAEKPVRAILADRLAGWFVAAILVIAVIVAGVWWHLDSTKALWVVLSVLVVTCPCALSLATPAALTVATGALRQSGFLIRKGHVLEALANINRCVFDKTGTLTLGNMKIKEVEAFGNTTSESILGLAAALEKGSAHPIAKAFQTKTFQHLQPPLPTFNEVQFSVGQGVSGKLNGQQYAFGKRDFVIDTLGIDIKTKQIDPSHDHGLILGNTDGLVGRITLEDELRPGAHQALKALEEKHIAVELLSGDQSDAARNIATELGIINWRGEASPKDKLTHIQSFQAKGDQILMVGDGINDVPVLSAADVSVAMGDAVDLTRLHADSILISGNLNVLPLAISLAKKTRRIISQNLTWALIYNAAALPLACAGLVPPWAAAIGMSFSSLLVVLNALRLNKVELINKAQLTPSTPLETS